jgi:hypothetical protein
MKSAAHVVGAIVVSALAAGVMVSARQIPIEPAKQSGTGITPSYEGWFDNADGTHNFLVGYLNRNRSLEVDVPIGPNNRIEPGGPDLGQPTHFLAGRQTGTFIITVPKAFTAQQRLTWTLTVNGQTNAIPLRLIPEYNVSPLKDSSVANTPPTLRFAESGPSTQGPLSALANAATRKASVSTPLELSVWTDDDAKYTNNSSAPMRGSRPPVTLLWAKYRGPGTVTFDKARPTLEKLKGGGVNEPYSGLGKTTAKFSEPGEYVLQVTANDYSGDGGGGFVCCWSNSLVKVTVTP